MRPVSVPDRRCGEIARRMAGEMAEQLAAQVAGDADEGMACDPAGETPQQIVGGDQRHQQARRPATRRRRRGPADSVSTRNFTPYCVLTEQPTAPSTAAQNRGMRQHPPAHIAQQEGDRPCRRSR